LFSPLTGCRFDRDHDGELRFVAGANHRHVVLCSRSGRLKKMQSRSPASLDRQRFTLRRLRDAAGQGDIGRDAIGQHGLTLAVLAGFIAEEANAHGAAIQWQNLLDPYGDCQTASAANARAGQLLAADIEAAKGNGGGNFLVDFFGDAQMTIWDAFAERLMSAEQERRYRAQFETAVLCYAAPCPILTAERLLALHRAGRLSVLPHVQKAFLSAEDGHFEIRHAFGSEQAKFLINTRDR
jgi:hypothetical protein